MAKLLLFLAAVVIAALAITLKSTLRRLRRAQNEAQQSRDELQQIAHAVSHDLPEPLRAITGFTSLLQEDYADQLDETGKEFLGYIGNSSHRMSKMLAGLLEYSRVKTLGEPLLALDPNPVLAQVREQLAERIRETKAEITTATLPRVMADEKQIKRLFRHAIENSLRFTFTPIDGGATPKVDIRAQKLLNGMVEFQFEDNGIGVLPKQAEAAFKLFRKLQPQDDYPGAGTGLAICRRIVRRHGGQIWFKESGSGAILCFTLPTA